MLISITLILAVAFFDINAWALLMLALTWIPDVAIVGIIWD